MGKSYSNAEFLYEADITDRVETLENAFHFADYYEGKKKADEYLKKNMGACAEYFDLREVLEKFQRGNIDKLINDSQMSGRLDTYLREVFSIDVDEWPFTRLNWNEVLDDYKDSFTQVRVNGTLFWYESY